MDAHHELAAEPHAIARAQADPVRRIGLARIITAITLGNALEFFDFTVYGFLTIQIGKQFYSTFDANAQVLLTIATFGVGFVMRPLGGVLIGVYADRAGRKKALTLTMMLMALGSGMIAVAPTYAQIGLAASAIVLLARMVQGFSAGGEVGPSTTMLIEYAGAKGRGYMASWQFASQGLGIFFGAALVSALSVLIGPQNMDDWGWRIPFLIGMLIAPAGFYIRKQLNDTFDLEEASRHVAAARRGALAEVLGDHGGKTIAAIVMTMGSTVAAYVITFYMPTYAVRQLGLSPTTAIFAAVIIGLLSFGLAPPVGYVSDRIGRKPLVLWSRVALAVLVYPCFLWLNRSPDPLVLFTVVAVLGITLVVQTTASITMLPEMFPRHVRATGMSIVYSVGVAIFGGFSPFVSAWLVGATGSTLAPAWYLLAMTLVSLAGLIPLKEFGGKEID